MMKITGYRRWFTLALFAAILNQGRAAPASVGIYEAVFRSVHESVAKMAEGQIWMLSNPIVFEGEGERHWVSQKLLDTVHSWQGINALSLKSRQSIHLFQETVAFDFLKRQVKIVRPAQDLIENKKALMVLFRERLDHLQSRNSDGLFGAVSFSFSPKMEGLNALIASVYRYIGSRAKDICGPYGVRGCEEGLLRLTRIGRPSALANEQYLALRDLARNKFRSVRVQKALLNLVLKLEESISTRDSRIGRDLFNDLKMEFVDLGLDEKQAANETFEVLAIYGSRGASTGVFELFSNSDTAYSVAAISVLATQMGVLDQMRTELENETSLYSIPSRFKTALAFGKPYHFWMSAYLAYFLVQEGVSPRAAALAVQLFAAAYHFSGTMLHAQSQLGNSGFSIGKDPRTTFEASHRPPNVQDIHDNAIRLSLLFNASGATFGAQYGMKPGPIPSRADLKVIFEEVFQNIPMLNQDEIARGKKEAQHGFGNYLESFRVWEKRITPVSFVQSLWGGIPDN